MLGQVSSAGRVYCLRESENIWILCYLIEKRIEIEYNDYTMQKKIYVVGMFDDDTAAKVQAAVAAVAGVTNAVANCEKSQVLVDYGDASQEDAINAAISSCGVDVIG